MTQPTREPGAGPRWWVASLLLVLTVLCIGVVIAMALSFQASPSLLWIELWVTLLVSVLAAAVRNGPLSGFGLIILATGDFSLWWMTILPSNERHWRPDVSQLLTAEIDPPDPSRVVLRNLRNFDWRTSTEATKRWETRDYDLDTLESLDFILTWWGGPGIAHTIVSFGFSDGQHIAFSLGIRPKRGEAYSSVAGFFKPYELILTEADERDVVQLRTSVQTGNRVVLYRIHGDRAILRPLFLEYLDLANNLAERPRFYRTILDNCTTVIWKLVDRGVLDMRYSLQQLTVMGLLPASVEYDGTSAGFSAAIRAGLTPH